MLVTQYFADDVYRGKTVFVTGGGSGINLGIAKNFAALGANVAICGRSQDRLDAAAEELRALGAKTVYWEMNFRQRVGTPNAPMDPVDVRDWADRVFYRAVASSACATPWIARRGARSPRRTCCRRP